MTRTCLVSCGSALLAMSACAAHSVSHNAPDESRPHITWDIRAGGDDGDDRVMCTNTSPPRSCALPATTAASSPSRVTVHLYLHPAALQTNYLGTMRVTFMQGSSVLSAHEVSGSVEPGSQPLTITVDGLVTSEPGSYELSIALDAIQEGSTTSQRIVDTAPVTVK